MMNVLQCKPYGGGEKHIMMAIAALILTTACFSTMSEGQAYAAQRSVGHGVHTDEKNAINVPVRDLNFDALQSRTANKRDDDLEMTAEIWRKLAAGAVLDPEKIKVRITDGHVTLEGTIGSSKEKNAAYFAAWASGVRSVTSHVTVAFFSWQVPSDSLSDDELQSMIHSAYARDARMDQAHPYVSVHGGMVTLSGEVDSSQTKIAATEIALQLEGVKWVRNDLEVE